MTRTHRFRAAAAAIVLSAAASQAAGPPTVSATIQPSQVSPTTYGYSMSLTDSAASGSPAGTYWFAWLPGKDFMTTSPLTVSDPAGWTHAITGGGTNNGYAIQWIAGPGAAVPVGSSLAGFNFTSVDPPSSLFGNSVYYPTTPVLTSVAYGGAPFSDAGTTFTPTAAVPEPAAFGLLSTGALLFRRRKHSRR